MRKYLSVLVVVNTVFLVFFAATIIRFNKPPINNHAATILPIIEEEKKQISIDDVLSDIREDQIKTNLEYLASDELEGRMSGKKGNVLAAEYIKNQYEKFGLETMYQKFPVKRDNPGPKREMGDDFTQNVYAWINGTDPVLKSEILVIGAHLDHIGYGPSMSRAPYRKQIHPGADDNASGTCALLEIAEAFSSLKDTAKRTVVFQSYSAEELGLIGSRYYCNNPVFPQDKPDIKKHIAMINLDMVGWLDKKTSFYGFDNANSSSDIGLLIDELNGKYSFAKKITSRTSGGSDHASFYNKGIPVAFLHTGLHEFYHTPGDTADKINYKGIESIARYAFELAWKICQADSAPTFRAMYLEPMPYIHDHGHPETPFPHYHIEKD